MSSSIIPEKFAMYFATMNSLSSKIYSDIQAVEEAVKFPQNLTYSEKCAILDKHLIHDVVNNKKPFRGAAIHSEDIKEPVYYDDPVLDQDQISALLLTVCPKKPEKYIYDDNSFWIDEHSVPYSCCTQIQANVCKLGDFVKALPPPLLTHQKSTTGAAKSKHIPANNKQNYGRKQSVGSGTQSEEESDYDSCPETDTENDISKKEMDKNQTNQCKPPTRMAFMGVPVMGFMGSSAPPKKAAPTTQDSRKNTEEESNLPQQKQNSDLIAELQAKLKMNKANARGSNPSKPQTQKVSKPKAPPPPPPKVPIPGMAVKVTAPLAPPEKIEKKTEVITKPKLQKSVQATSSIQKSSEQDKKSKMSKEKSTEEFVVDISSPCKIVTPKTGFDFLDNW